MAEAKTYNKLILDIKKEPTDIITAVQDDTNSRYLDVVLLDDGTPIDLTGLTVRIYIKKSGKDGYQIFNDGEITDATNGRCQFLLTTQALSAFGVLETQISIWNDGGAQILSSPIFNIFVSPSLVTDGDVPGTNEYGALVALFQDIQNALDLIEELNENFQKLLEEIGVSGEVAAGIPVSTFWQMLEALYTINQKALSNSSVSEVLSRIGTAADTGATETTGTLMGKANTVITDVKSLIAAQEKLYISSNNEKKVLVNGRLNTIDGYMCIGSFVPKYNGYINISGKLLTTDDAVPKRTILLCIRATQIINLNNGTDYNKYFAEYPEYGDALSLSLVNNNNSNSSYFIASASDENVEKTFSVGMFVEKNRQYVFVLYGSNTNGYCEDIKISFDEVDGDTL